jgi:hypothetical protein
MHADEHDVVDSPLFQHVPHLDPRIADGILRFDLEPRVLTLPRRLRVPAHFLELGVPLLVLDRIVVLTAV